MQTQEITPLVELSVDFQRKVVPGEPSTTLRLTFANYY
jgi:hypothetical protein